MLSTRGPRTFDQLRSLVSACHPGPTAAVIGLTGLLTRTARSPRRDAFWAVAAVACGQLVIGWSNDLVDAGRDRAAGRADKPIARGELRPSSVALALAGASLGCVGCSLRRGKGWAGTHLLLGVGSGLAYNLGLKKTRFSFLPFALAFGVLPRLARPADPSAPPTSISATAGAALLGVGAHIVNVLPDLADDEAAGIRGLPHRLGPSRSRVLAATVLICATVVLFAGHRSRGPRQAAGLLTALALTPWSVGDNGRRGLAGVVVIALVDAALLASDRPLPDAGSSSVKSGPPTLDLSKVMP